VKRKGRQKERKMSPSQMVRKTGVIHPMVARLGTSCQNENDTMGTPASNVFLSTGEAACLVNVDRSQLDVLYDKNDLQINWTKMKI